MAPLLPVAAKSPAEKPKCLQFPEKPYQLDADGLTHPPACIIKQEGDTGKQSTPPANKTHKNERHADSGFLYIA